MRNAVMIRLSGNFVIGSSKNGDLRMEISCLFYHV
jgi:hypothetical protein